MSEIFHKRQPSPYGIVEDFIRSPEFTLSHGEREQDKKGSHTGLPLLFTSDLVRLLESVQACAQRTLHRLCTDVIWSDLAFQIQRRKVHDGLFALTAYADETIFPNITVEF